MGSFRLFLSNSFCPIPNALCKNLLVSMDFFLWFILHVLSNILFIIFWSILSQSLSYLKNNFQSLKNNNNHMMIFINTIKLQFKWLRQSWSLWRGLKKENILLRGRGAIPWYCQNISRQFFFFNFWVGVTHVKEKIDLVVWGLKILFNQFFGHFFSFIKIYEPKTVWTNVSFAYNFFYSIFSMLLYSSGCCSTFFR